MRDDPFPSCRIFGGHVRHHEEFAWLPGRGRVGPEQTAMIEKTLLKYSTRVRLDVADARPESFSPVPLHTSLGFEPKGLPHAST